MAREFKLSTWSKVRPLRHLPKGFALPDGKSVTGPSGTSLTNSDLTDESGVVNAEACAFFQVDPSEVRPIVRADLGPVYEGSDGSAMLREYAKAEGKSENDMLCELVISARGEDEYYNILRALKPKTEKVVSRSWETILADFPGLTREQVEAMLRAAATAQK